MIESYKHMQIKSKKRGGHNYPVLGEIHQFVSLSSENTIIVKIELSE